MSDDKVYYQSPFEQWDFGYGEMYRSKIVKQSYIEDLEKFSIYISYFKDEIKAHFCVKQIELYDITTKENIKYIFTKFPNVQKILIRIENINDIPEDIANCEKLNLVELFEYTEKLPNKIHKLNKTYISNNKMIIWMDEYFDFQIPENITHVIIPYEYSDDDILDKLPDTVEILEVPHSFYFSFAYSNKPIPSNLKKIFFYLTYEPDELPSDYENIFTKQQIEFLIRKNL